MSVYKAIASLDLSQEERKSLRVLFTNNLSKKLQAEEIIPTCTNKEQVDYLRELMTSDEHQDCNQRLEKIENKLKECCSMVLSAIDFENMQQIQDHLNLKFKYIEWLPIKTQVTIQSQKFTWSKQAEDTQSEEYMKYLKEAIKLPSGLEWYNAKKNQKFLNAVNQKWLPFNLKGTTDIAILTKGYSECLGQECVGCRIVIELKKKVNIDAKARFQTQGELITANHWSNHEVLAILTDLNDYWEFFWEYGNEICSYKPVSHQNALQMLQVCVDAESRDFKRKSNEFDEDYPFVKRKKLNTTSIKISDVADFNDFADVMPEVEMKSKMLDSYLREVFVNSTSYGQFEMSGETSYYV